MELKLIKDSIYLNNRARTEETQLMLEGDIIVPDINPDIDSILRADGNININEKNIGDGRVIFKGDLKIDILYQAKNSEYLLHTMQGVINFEDFINIEGVTDSSNVSLNAVIDHLEYKLINDRKINIKAIVKIIAQIHTETSYEIIKEVSNESNVQALTGFIKLNNIVEDKNDTFEIKELITLPAGKPNIREILDTDITISDKEVKAMDGRVLIKGLFNVSLVYIGDTDESIVEVVEQETAFTTFIEARNSEENMMATAQLSTGNVSTQIIPDSDGEERAIDIVVTMGVNLTVIDNEEIELIEDAYSLDESIGITRENVVYSEVVNNNRSKYVVKETLTLDERYPEIMQVIKAWGSVSLDEAGIANEAVVVEGTVAAQLMYVAKSDTLPINVVSFNIPFKQEIETKGANDAMRLDISSNVESISFNMLSSNEVELRVTLGFDVLITKNMNGTVITNIENIETAENEAKIGSNVVVYVVQRGDSLWSIAKKYNTTIEDIVMVNEIENPDNIMPGQRLLILRKVS